jgi:UDP:flavonoid glycosyltransferase YjiC (YdhE family)
MPHIVVVTSGIMSLVNSAFALAQQLVAAGHQVTFASAAPIEAAVTAQGLPFVQLGGEVPHQHVDQASSLPSRIARWLRKPFTIRTRQQQVLRSLALDDFAEKLTRLAPDLCIIDIELSAAIITACSLNIPTATLAAFISLYKYPNVPPLHLDIVPGVGWRGSTVGIEWVWLRFRLWKWAHFGLQRLRAVGADPISVLRQQARAVGFPFEQEVDMCQWLLPFVFRRLPLLYTNAHEFDFPHDPVPNCAHLGPMIQLDRRDAPMNSAPGDAYASLETLFARRQQTPERKLIYCAFGAAFKGDDSEFLRKVVEAVREETGWDVILALGGRRDPRDLGELPPHVHAYRWVPQPHVLEHADCAVIHGGIGTMNECIHFQVPMVVYPFKNTNDQLGAAARIAYHRLGIVGDREQDDPSRIRSHIHTLLSDKDCHARIAAMNAHFRRYRDEQRAVTIINQLLTDARNDVYPLFSRKA